MFVTSVGKTTTKQSPLSSVEATAKALEYSGKISKLLSGYILGNEGFRNLPSHEEHNKKVSEDDEYKEFNVEGESKEEEEDEAETEEEEEQN